MVPHVILSSANALTFEAAAVLALLQSSAARAGIAIGLYVEDVRWERAMVTTKLRVPGEETSVAKERPALRTQ